MMAKFAKAIAHNIRIIAVNTTHVILIDQMMGPKPSMVYSDRVRLVKEIDKAEANIAALLQEPGAKLED